MPLIIRATNLLPLAATLLASAALAQPAPKRPLDAEMWRADLRVLAEQLPKVHPNAFHEMTREQFEQAVRDLDRRIPTLRRDQILAGFARLVAMVRDGHTHIDPSSMGVRAYPVRLFSFTDGVYVIEASQSNAAIVGGRVVRIGDAPIDRAYREVRAIVPTDRDNEMWCRNLGVRLLAVPELVAGLGLVPDMENAEVVVEKEGRNVSAVLHPGPVVAENLRHHWPPLPAGWVSARNPGEAPLWLKDPTNPYWFEYLERPRVVYVQYNAVQDKAGEPVAAFFERVSRFIDANRVDKLVIDVRLNGGGNNYLNLPLLRWILRADKVNQPGRMFTVIGRQTFSAAQNFVNMMEKYTGTIFVGEPTGEAPNMFGDPGVIRLPNSGLVVRASTLWWQDMDQRDTRQWTPPRVAAEMSFDDYRRNVDPAMEAILTYRPPASLSDQVRTALERDDVAGARAAVQAFRADPRNAYVTAERDLYIAGRDLMSGGKPALAVIAIKLWTEAYPTSPDAYLCLGEAYANTGNRGLAIASYSKALELDPRSLGAAAALAKLEGER